MENERMTKLELWEMLGGVVFIAGAWVTLSGIVLLLLSMAMHGLGAPGK